MFNRFAAFKHTEKLWLVLALTWARCACAERNDPELIELHDEATRALRGSTPEKPVGDDDVRAPDPAAVMLAKELKRMNDDATGTPLYAAPRPLAVAEGVIAASELAEDAREDATEQHPPEPSISQDPLDVAESLIAAAELDLAHVAEEVECPGHGDDKYDRLKVAENNLNLAGERLRILATEVRRIDAFAGSRQPDATAKWLYQASSPTGASWENVLLNHGYWRRAGAAVDAYFDSMLPTDNASAIADKVLRGVDPARERAEGELDDALGEGRR